MKIKENDFIEIEFTGYSNGEIFDTTNKKKAEKLNLDIEIKPAIVCVGQKMLVEGFDAALKGKEIGKKYKIKLPEDSFGKRQKNLIKIIPAAVFKEKNINPVSGMTLNFDGMMAKILSVSGGRITADFNNPLSGKEIEYEFKILRKVDDENEKINALQDFFFKKRFKFKIKDKKIIFEKQVEPFIQLFGEKFNKILKKKIEIEKEKHTNEK